MKLNSKYKLKMGKKLCIQTNDMKSHGMNVKYLFRFIFFCSKLFLDSLVVAGTGPSVLLVRDIAQETENTVWLARLIAPLPHYVRNPTEKLVQEMEPLMKSGMPKHNERMIKFAFATLVHRACAKTGCAQSGLLDKYVNKWSQEYDSKFTIACIPQQLTVSYGVIF